MEEARLRREYTQVIESAQADSLVGKAQARALLKSLPTQGDRRAWVAFENEMGRTLGDNYTLSMREEGPEALTEPLYLITSDVNNDGGSIYTRRTLEGVLRRGQARGPEALETAMSKASSPEDWMALVETYGPRGARLVDRLDPTS